MGGPNVNRRQALCLGVGAVATAALPPQAPVPTVLPPPAQLFPAWEVGTDAWPTWRVIYAETEARAKQIFREESGGGICADCDGLRCAELDPDGECEHSNIEARGVSEKVLAPEPFERDAGADKPMMQALGWQHYCDRCHYDQCGDWQIVGEEAVCNDCMELEDWAAVNPKYHAKLLEEQQLEFWEEFAETLQEAFGPRP